MFSSAWLRLCQRRRHGWAVASFAALVLAQPALAEPPLDPAEWTGKVCMPKEQCRARQVRATAFGTARIDDESLSVPFHITGVRGDWLELGDVRLDRHGVVGIDEAVDYYTEYLKAGKYKAWAHFMRAMVWMHRDELNQAISDFTEAIAIFPEYHAAYNNRGNAWNRQRVWDRALADYGKSIEIAPDLSPSYNNRAWLLATCPDAKLRSGSRAVADATKACELTGWQDYETIDTLAAAQAEAGNFPEAVKWQTKALELSPPAEMAPSMQARLELYRERKPFHQPADQPGS